MVFFYNFTLFLYFWLIRVLAFFNPKAKLWLAGRQGIFEKIKKQLHPNRPVIWMHCASLGEFEQGRPILENIRSSYPQHQIVLSFFSPSGYEIRKDYPIADLVTYLPLDSKKNAHRWMELVQPRLVIFVKYEFWHHYLQAIKKAACPGILISATFRSSQIFFKPYGLFFRKMLFCFDHIFVQEKKDQDLLNQIGIKEITIAGDTRVDRVLQIAKSAKSFPLIEKFSAKNAVLVLGSSWPAEEAILAEHLNKNKDSSWKFIIVPHEIGEDHLLAIEKKMPLPIIRYSKANPTSISNYKILLIDNIGMLSTLYKYGKIAFIGGGFGTGIHNILEPIAFGLPVLFGPRYHKFREAKSLVKSGGAFSIKDAQMFSAVFSQLEDHSKHQGAVENIESFLNENKGATTQIMAFINQEVETN